MSIKKELLKNVPHFSGIYIFKSSSGKILYIGKAKNLKSRLSSYFQNRSSLTPAKKKMMNEAASISWQRTESDIGALILEASLIKKYRPKYNILMRDDKNYFFVSFGKEKYPRIKITHQPWANMGNPFVIGPFTDGTSLKSTLKTLRKVFPYCTCKGFHKKSCVSYQIGRCLGVCCLENMNGAKTELEKKYKKNIIAVKNILSGKRSKVISELNKEMQALSKERKYEGAQSILQKILALEKIFKHKHVLEEENMINQIKALKYLQTLLGLKQVPKRIETYDISNIHGKDAVGSMVVFIDGLPQKSEYKRFKIKLVSGINDPAMIAEVLFRRMRHNDWPKPDLIVIDGGITQYHAAKKAMDSTGKKTALISLAKGSRSVILSSEKNIKLETLPSPVKHLLEYVISEAHKFAISYHRLRRKKTLI